MTSSISIKNIGKCYKVYSSRNERLKEWLLPFGASRHAEKWVLRDINLEVNQGEAIGIIGMNGAGKSTLLKIITGTTLPTTGQVHFDGKVAALLELGLGFHPDFTGRQNVCMSGQLLGYSTDEVASCMSEIESFAEIGEAIDAPVRTYSSGMQVRLAFSVATMKRPDILIVDEALSVGDTYFQHKSFARIKAFRKEGTTLLLVSHDKAAIQSVCDRAVLLDHGKILKIGKPIEVMDFYNAMLGGNNSKPITQKRITEGRVQTISGNGDAEILEISFLNSNEKFAEICDVGERVELHVLAKVKKNIRDLTCGMMIKNRLGEDIYGINSGIVKKSIKDVSPEETVEFVFYFDTKLGEGTYSITVALHGGRTHINNSYDWRDFAVIFEVVNKTKKTFVGVAYLDARVETVVR
jgi:lipopolysaccharide transport system ATP-binding protein